MLIPLEDRWELLSVLEQEHGAREALMRLHASGDLKFTSTPEAEQADLIRDTASLYVAQSLKQSKELFRQAESSSWLVKPLLLYYAMLTCAKGCLAFAFPDFMKSSESRRHGISTNNEFRNTLDLTNETVRITGDGVYSLVRAALQLARLPPNSSIQIQHILTRLPEVDGWYRLLFNRTKEPLDWIKINGSIVVPSSDGYHVGFSLAEDLYRSVESRIPTTIRDSFNIQGFKHSSGEMFTGFSSKNVWQNEHQAISLGTPAVLSRTLDNNNALILPIETDGVKYDFSEVELNYLLMFYFSSIARYQPHLWLQLQAGAKDFSVLLCQNILSSCENKFLRLVNARLYYTVSLPLIPPVAGSA